MQTQATTNYLTTPFVRAKKLFPSSFKLDQTVVVLSGFEAVGETIASVAGRLGAFPRRSPWRAAVVE